MNISLEKNKRLDGLEVLRGLAASAVVFFHVWALAGFSNKSAFLDAVAPYLSKTVQLFFCISAFSLLYGYEKNFFDEFTMKRFFLRRIFRIVPLFYTMIIIYGIFTFIVYKTKFDLWTYLLNFSFTFSLVPTKQESIVWGGWSLGIEWIFYISFPLYVYITKNRLALLITTLAFSIISIKFSVLTKDVVSASPTIDYYNFVKQFMYFLVGAIVYRLLPVIELFKNNHKWINKIEILYISFTILLFPLFNKFLANELIVAIFAFMMTIWAVIGFSRIFNNKITRLLGKFSYGLYLLNGIVIASLGRTGIYEFIKEHANNTLSFVICSVVSLLVTGLLAAVLYYCIEQPSIALGNITLKKMENAAINKVNNYANF